MPFLFHPTPVPQAPQTHPWEPPPRFSPSKAFPEVDDVDMTEAGPFRDEDSKAKGEEIITKENDLDSTRPVATGGLRRVFKQRTQRLHSRRKPREHESDEGSSSGIESEEDGPAEPITQNTSNHYTLNMAANPVPQSDLPYILLG